MSMSDAPPLTAARLGGTRPDEDTAVSAAPQTAAVVSALLRQGRSDALTGQLPMDKAVLTARHATTVSAAPLVAATVSGGACGDANSVSAAPMVAATVSDGACGIKGKDARGTPDLAEKTNGGERKRACTPRGSSAATDGPDAGAIPLPGQSPNEGEGGEDVPGVAASALPADQAWSADALLSYAEEAAAMDVEVECGCIRAVLVRCMRNDTLIVTATQRRGCVLLERGVKP